MNSNGNTPADPNADLVLVYKAKDGFRWRRVAPNGRIVAESGEAFTRHAYALESAERYNPDAILEDDG